ncbi:MAG: hypothetical protein IJJ40_03870 [Clostridia bacterium]|nr:hypothetical protein [Clostridia bacterium]
MKLLLKAFLPCLLALLLTGCTNLEGGGNLSSDDNITLNTESETSSFWESETATDSSSNIENETTEKAEETPVISELPKEETSQSAVVTYDDNRANIISEPPASSAPKEEEKEPSISDKTEIFQIVNIRRAEAGVSPLVYRNDLEAAADKRAKEISRYFSHTRPDGRSCFTAVSDDGITYMAVGENIAYGYRTATSVMNGWMNSEGHRRNILSPDFTGMAVGEYIENGIKYHVQIFIR